MLSAKFRSGEYKIVSMILDRALQCSFTTDEIPLHFLPHYCASRRKKVFV